LINAITIEIEGVTTKIFRLEYAMAIKIQAGRAKDWGHIEIAMESAEPYRSKLEDILKRFDLFDVWRKHGYG
jgi:predicted nucleotidyltransferase